MRTNFDLYADLIQLDCTKSCVNMMQHMGCYLVYKWYMYDSQTLLAMMHKNILYIQMINFHKQAEISLLVFKYVSYI